MLFHEVYSRYFKVISMVLKEAVEGTLTSQTLEDLVRKTAFAESVLTLPSELKSGEWRMLDEQLHTPLHHVPTVPLTTLEKRWMKALLMDSRIQLFAPSVAGLEDIKPLFRPETFVYFDRHTDGDPFYSEKYGKHFQTILTALREKRKIQIKCSSKRGNSCTWNCTPYCLEYSAKDDKFRLLTIFRSNDFAINLEHITECSLLEPYSLGECHKPKIKERTLILELLDERKALERVMLHFSHFKKETVRLDHKRYRITLHYDQQDETELLVRILSFGPMLQVTAPLSIVKQIKQRLAKQKSCEY